MANRESERNIVNEWAEKQRKAGKDISASDSDLFFAINCLEDLRPDQEARVKEMHSEIHPTHATRNPVH